MSLEAEQALTPRWFPSYAVPSRRSGAIHLRWPTPPLPRAPGRVVSGRRRSGSDRRRPPANANFFDACQNAAQSAGRAPDRPPETRSMLPTGPAPARSPGKRTRRKLYGAAAGTSRSPEPARPVHRGARPPAPPRSLRALHPRREWAVSPYCNARKRPITTILACYSPFSPCKAIDMIVIGSGPAGQRAAIQAAKSGKRVAVVEQRECVGGACINTGTIPSKTLARGRDASFRLRLPGHLRRQLPGEREDHHVGSCSSGSSM